MLRKHGTHRSNVVVIITIVSMSVTMYSDGRGEATQSNPVTTQDSLEFRWTKPHVGMGAVGDTSLMVLLVSASCVSVDPVSLTHQRTAWEGSLSWENAWTRLAYGHEARIALTVSIGGTRRTRCGTHITGIEDVTITLPLNFLNSKIPEKVCGWPILRMSRKEWR